jgi:hypothetical protein
MRSLHIKSTMDDGAPCVYVYRPMADGRFMLWMGGRKVAPRTTDDVLRHVIAELAEAVTR